MPQGLSVISFEPLEDAAAPQAPLSIVSFEPLDAAPARSLAEHDAAEARLRAGETPALKRPPPITVPDARQFTSGVKVTEPTVAPPVAAGPSASMPTMTRGRFTGLPGRDVTSATPEPLTEGAMQIGKGVAALGRQLAHPQVLPVEPHVMRPSPPGADTAALNAGSDLLEGAMKLATPLAVAGALVDLPGTAATLALSYLASAAAGKAADIASATPEMKRFVSNVTGAATALGGAKVVMGRLAEVPAAAQRTGRVLALAGRLSGYGPGDVPGYRGEPATMGEFARQSERPPSAATLKLEESIRQEGRVAEAAARAEPEAPAPDVAAPPQEVASPKSEVPSPAPIAAAAPLSIVKAEPLEPETHDYSSTQVNLPAETASAITQLAARIPDADLAKDGRETDPHITVKFGLHTADAEKVRAVLADEPPITAMLGKTSIFPNGESDNGDVVKVDVDSHDLHRLNAKIADALEHTDTHPEYKPHATIAYVKPGLGKKYAGDATLEGHTVTIDHVTFSGKDGTVVDIPLTGTPSGPIIEAPYAPNARNDQGAPPAGPRRQDSGDQRPAPDESGTPARGSEGHRAQGGGVPSAGDPYEGLSFVRRSPKENAPRFTPEVRRELERMADELDTFPFVEHTWTDLSHETGLYGNAAGGHMRKVSGSAGAPVYVDILSEAPLAKPRRGKDGTLRYGRKVSAQRSAVLGAVRHVLTTSDIPSHIAEGAVRVAEKRAAGDWSGLSAAWLPPSWETRPEPPADLDQVIDDMLATEEGDASFDPVALEAQPTSDMLSTGEQQPRLPEAGTVRDTNVQTPTFEAPFSLTGGTDTTAREREADLFSNDDRDKPQFSRADDAAPIFYSALTRAAENLPQAKGVGPQMLAMLTKAKGVKQEELAWSGIADWLKSQGPVTRQAIIDYLRANEIQVTETILGAESPDVMKKRGEQFALANDIDEARAKAFGPGTQGNAPGQIPPQIIQNVARWVADVYRGGDNADLARHKIDQLGLSAPHREALLRYGELANRSRVLNEEVLALNKPARFAAHTIPGGEDYRELLLTLPVKTGSAVPMHEAGATLSRAEEALRLYREAHPTIETEEGLRNPDYRRLIMERNAAGERLSAARETVAGDKFKGGHFAEPNVVAHVRFDDRTDQYGKKVLFVEEVQSDWHQKGRKEGYRAHNETEARRLLTVKNEAAARWDNAQRPVGHALAEMGNLGFDTTGGAIRAVRDAVDWRDRFDLRDAPEGLLALIDTMKDAWSDYIAASHAYERVAGPRGISGVPDAPFKTTWPELAMKRVVRYAAEHGYDRVAWTTGEQQAERYDLSLHADEVKAFRRDDGAYDFMVKPKGDTSRHLRDITNVSASQLVETVGKDLADKIAAQPKGWQTYSGLDLKVGGAGMRGFYDQILPSFMNKFGKPFGARVGETHLTAEGYGLANNDTARAAAIGAIPVHAIDITPMMAETAMQGLPLFAKRQPTIEQIRRQGTNETRDLERAYDTMPMRQIGGARVPVYDTGQRLHPPELHELLGNRGMQAATRAIVAVTDRVLTTLLGEARPRIERVGLLFDQESYGVFFPRPRSGPTRRVTILVNPLEPIRRGSATPSAVARHLFETIVHESVHADVAGHGPAFKVAYAGAIERLGPAFEATATKQLTEAYADPEHVGRLRPDLARAVSLYSTSRGRRGIAGDALGRAGGYERRPADDREGPPRDVSDVRHDGADTPAEDRQLAEDSSALESTEREHAMLGVETAAVPLRTAALGLQAAGAEVRALLTAPTVSHPARLSSRYLRWRIAQMMHTVSYANHALKTYRNALEGMSVDHAAILDLADALEDPQGTGKRLPPWLRPWAKIRAEVFTYLKKQIADLGIEKEWRAEYLGHIWETEFKEGGPALPQQVLARLIGRRPLQGPKTFLKHRTIPTMRDGVERFGKEPKTWNLVDIDLYKMQEMAKFILGRQALEDNKQLGTWVFRTALKKAPEGMLPIPDAIGQVWAPPEITVAEAYDKLLMEGLENFIRGLGVQYERTTGGGKKWGGSNAKTGDITARFGGPEGVLMHEIGHTLDLQFGLYDRIAKALKTPEFPGDKSALKELRALAELRYEGVKPDDAFKRYVQTHDEQIANLVHAYLYAPEQVKAVAPSAYDALDELVLTEPALAPLADLQQMRSLVLGTREATYRLPGPMLLGRYYATPDVVRIFTNYLTPGLSANRLWAMLRIPANAMVQAKLSFSAFHAFTITQESAAMEAARGMTAVLRGHPITGAARIGKALAEPAAVIARGRAVRKEYLSTLDPLSLAVDSATNLLLAGGGRIEQSREYTNRSLQKFADNLRRLNGAFVRQQYGRAGAESLGAALHLLPALVEAASYPILQWLVPTAKAGATTTQIRTELEALPGEPTEQTLLAIASKAVNLADATLGEVIWDNYFMPRALMSAVHMVIMAPGWRGGSAVLLARGVTDPVRRLFPSQRETYTVRVPTTGGAGGRGPGTPPAGAPADATPPEEGTRIVDVKEPYWSPYTSLAIATVLVQVLVSELYQLAHGAGHVKSLLDVAYPRTGELARDGKPERVRLPGYAGIFYDILRDVPASVLEYALGGTAPMPTMIGQLYHNEDPFGTEIATKGDPWRVQLSEYVKFLETQFEPIAVSSFGRRAGTTVEKGESLAGISPAPARVTRSPMEAYLHEIAGPPHRTQEAAARSAVKRDLREAVRTGDREAIRAAAQSGTMKRQDLKQTIKGAKRASFDYAFQRASFAQALKAYELATPEERAEVKVLLAKKVRPTLERTPAAERGPLMLKYRGLLALPVAPAARSAGASP